MFATPTRLLFASQLIGKWLSLYVPGATFFHTPRQKLCVTGGREEFRISVPSLCHWENPLSITVPSGGPGLPWAVRVTCQNPTIASAFSETRNSDADPNSPIPCQDCGWSEAP